MITRLRICLALCIWAGSILTACAGGDLPTATPTTESKVHTGDLAPVAAATAVPVELAQPDWATQRFFQNTSWV